MDFTKNTQDAILAAVHQASQGNITKNDMLAKLADAAGVGAFEETLLDEDGKPSNALDVFIAYDQDFNYEVGDNIEQASERFNDNYAGDVKQTIHLRVTVPPLDIKEYTMTVPAHQGDEPVQVEVLPKL